jgi:hypothetical protein
MQVIVNTDSNVDGTERVAGGLETIVEESLARYGDRLTRVEVHLSDESAGRSSAEDITCTLEARPAGGTPVVVTESANTVEQSLAGALHKMKSLLETHFGKLDARKGNLPMGEVV